MQWIKRTIYAIPVSEAAGKGEHVPNVDGKPHRGDGHTDRTVVYGL